jgi:ribosomal-protein-alanine N-acetyltransferase
MEETLETQRLLIRKYTPLDFKALSKMLKDIDVMYAWEHSFSDKEVREWIDNNINRYEKDKTGYFSVIEKKTGNFTGQAGLHYSMLENRKILEIGYIFAKEFWNMGYAYESAKKLINYAFLVLNVKEIYALIRPENFRSAGLAKKLGFLKESSFLKHYMGKDMVHDIYILRQRTISK